MFRAFDVEPEDLQAALVGDQAGIADLIFDLRSSVQREVASSLRRHAGQAGRDANQEVADFVQEVFVGLLADDARVLRAWDPERGRTLHSFVRLVARRYVAAVMRTRCKNPWSELPTDGDALEAMVPCSAMADRVESRSLLERVLEEVYDEVDERGKLLFEMLYLEERSIAEVQAETGMSRDAIYAWRFRFRKNLRDKLSMARA
jgi:RNA polymerase sigma-70 factor (ECF subfamily)